MSEDDSVNDEGKWTRYDFARLDIHPLSLAGEVIDQVVAWLNAHHPKLEPYDQGGVRGADSLLYRAERERDAAVARAEALDKQLAKAMSDYQDIEDERDELKKFLKATEEVLDIERKQHEETGDNLVDANQRWLAAVVERDEWKARAEALKAEAEEAFEQGATWHKEQSAPAVSRDDIGNALMRVGVSNGVETHTEVSVGTDAVMELLSGPDPAVHVVRESDLPAARVDGDYYVAASAKGDYKWPHHGPSWWAGRAQDALAEAARYTSLARLAASEAVVDQVEAKARELYRAATPDARWETVADEYRRIARHVLGQEADQ